jgi:hypothetical protein
MCKVHDGEPELARLSRLRKSQIKGLLVPPRSRSCISALPLWDRNLLYVNSEAIAERCNEALNFAGLIDNRNPAHPRLMSLFPLPVPPKGAPYKNFCEKGGRFGPHNVNQEILVGLNAIAVKKSST